MYELFQALVGAVLPDDDYGASLLNSHTSHAGHATTRASTTQGDHQTSCTSQAPFAFLSLLSIIRFVLPNVCRIPRAALGASVLTARLGGKVPRSQVLGRQSRTFGESGEHPRPDLLAVVKRVDDIGPAGPRKGLV